MIEFTALSIALLMFAHAWAENIDHEQKDWRLKIVPTVLASLAAIGSVVCLIVALATAPWGSL